MKRSSALVAMLLAPCLAILHAAKITKETMSSSGKDRSYYLFVPDSVKDNPPPLVILLHGSGRDGRILVEHWESIAKREGIILAGPDATVREGWSNRDDGPLLFRHIVETLRAKLSFDPRRVYLFGHSAGAVHGLGIGILESEYFAAVALHAGSLAPTYSVFIDKAPRKIPIAIWVGTNDQFFPLKAVRGSRDYLNEHGFKVELTEIAGHTHNYYGRSGEINKAAWEFLSRHRLEKDPQYQDYVIQR
ncbi:MAG TPA: PHB depolymerase family esterase [Vicinamibacterales bacterium]|jgi:poly(3-hydroxybutyrate) depolymerase